ncbi:MAG: extensin family protein [Methylobacteriaceae bacterium]|nr:extensin family protein [Methylobacteriaceae bacterium]
MARSVSPFVALAAALLIFSGCGFRERAERPAWRAEAENACLAEKLVTVSDFIQPASEIDGPGICGLVHPFRVTALAGGTVALNAPQTLSCPMIPALDRWIAEVVQPASQASFGQPVVGIRTFGSYSCRRANNDPFAAYSEHAFANAIDLAAFRLADGREISVLRGWRGDPVEQSFLRTLDAGACGIFNTVLGPGYPLHDNHFHVDLAMHGNTSRGLRRICRPAPQTPLPEGPRRDNLPEPPTIEEDLDIAQAGSSDVGGSIGRGPSAGAPLALDGYQASVGPVPPSPMASPPPRFVPAAGQNQLPPEGAPSGWDLGAGNKSGD